MKAAICHINVLIILLFAYEAGFAQKKSKLYGYIFDSQTGIPIEKACILMEPGNLGAETDQDGIYFVPDLAAGEYEYTVMMIGYNSIEGKRIILKSGESKEMNFFLDPVILSSSDGIVVTATRGKSLTSEIPASVDVISAEKIALKAPQNMAEVLDNVQGVFVKDYGGLTGVKTISLRGSSSEQVLVLLDGQRLNNAQNGQVDFSTISLEGVEKVEIVRGGNSALYGADAIGGVINIITKKDNTDKGFSGSAKYALGSFESQAMHASINYQQKRFGGSVSYRRLSSKGNFSYIDPYGNEQEKKNNDLISDDFFSRFNFIIGDSLFEKRIDLSYKYYASERGSPGTTDVPYYYARLWNKNHEANAIFSGKVINLLNDFRLQGYVHSSNSRYINDEGTVNIDSRYKNGTYGFEGQMRTVLNTNFVFTYGAGIRQDWLNSEEFPDDHSRESYYVFIQDESNFTWPAHSTLTSISIVPALRLDSFSDFGTHVSPKIGGVFNFGTQWKTALKWNVGISFRAPNFNELYWPADSWTVGNPDLKPEHGYDWDLGIRFRYPILTGLSMDITYFSISMKDLILWQSVNQIWMPLNVDKAQNNGVELNVSLEPFWNMLSLTTNYTFLDARNLSDEMTVHNKTLVYRPKHTFNFSLNFNWEDINLGYDLSYVGRRYVTPANTVYLDPYNVSDIQMVYQRQFGKLRSIFSFQVRNIFDQKYEIIQYQPIPGREYRASINITFN